MPEGYKLASLLKPTHFFWVPRGLCVLSSPVINEPSLGINYPDWTTGCPEGYESLLLCFICLNGCLGLWAFPTKHCTKYKDPKTPKEADVEPVSHSVFLELGSVLRSRSPRTSSGSLAALPP